MITAKQIPDEVALAWTRAWYTKDSATIKGCLAAAINAWTHAERRRWTVPSVTPSECDAIILPIVGPRDDNG
jgi:hypothetical protein